MANNPFRQAALFVGHGSPLNAIANNDWTRRMLAWGKRLPRPKAILCISSHWLTDGLFVTSAARPRMIYDMAGFPPALYEVQYPAPGDPVLAQQIHEQFPHIRLDSERPWGFDHGAWSVLKFLFPAADVPVLQLSIDIARDARYHYKVGREISTLREQGVMLVGSGNIVHNLRVLSMQENDTPFTWAQQFDRWFAQHLQANDHSPLIDDYRCNEAGRLSVPTPDHYFPALVIAGARLPGDTLETPCDAILHGSLAMRSFQFG